MLWQWPTPCRIVGAVARARAVEPAPGAEPRATPVTTHLHSFDGTLLAVKEAGVRGGPPIVIANGLGGSILAWRPLLGQLAATYRFVSWDYRGMYDSAAPADPAALRIEDHVRDLEAVMAGSGVVRPVLIGWSMGVQVAVQYTLDHPDGVAGLVLVCGAPGDPFAGVFGTAASRRLVPAVCRAVEAAPAPFAAIVQLLVAFPWSPELLRRLGIVAPSCDLDLLRELAVRIARIDWRCYGRSIRAMGRHDAWPRLGELAVPLLAVGGAADRITPGRVAEEMAAAAAGEAVVFGRGTHYVPLEFPTELIERLERFLTDRVGTAGAAWRRREEPHVVEPMGR